MYLPEQMELDRQVESAFRCMLLACSGTVDPGLNFYSCFFLLLIQACSLEAVSKEKRKENVLFRNQSERNKGINSGFY